jgi:hypothetical protein
MRRTLLYFYVLLLAALLSALTACSGPKSTDQPAAASPAPAGQAAPGARATAAPTEVPAAAGNPSVDKLVTPADVEKISGLTGIKLVPRDPSKGAGGDLNFATQDDSLVLMVLVSGSSLYKQSKEETGYFHADVSGIGDEAFDGPADAKNYFAPPGGKADPFLLAFRKGTSMVTMSSFLGPDQKAYFSQEKLRELAKLVASRM